MTSKHLALVADATAAARKFVNDSYTDAGILTPRYSISALHQMGWNWSYGASKAYRVAYAEAFVLAWTARYAALASAPVLRAA